MNSYIIEVFEDESGFFPYETWLDTLDKKTAARIEAKVGRFRLGNFGDHKNVGEGVWEARLFFGPGYRLYFGKEKNKIILLLTGGDKSTQRRDILRAKACLESWRFRNG